MGAWGRAPDNPKILFRKVIFWILCFLVTLTTGKINVMATKNSKTYEYLNSKQNQIFASKHY